MEKGLVFIELDQWLDPLGGFSGKRDRSRSVVGRQNSLFEDSRKFWQVVSFVQFLSQSSKEEQEAHDQNCNTMKPSRQPSSALRIFQLFDRFERFRIRDS